jgi:hypothetical protein
MVPNGARQTCAGRQFRLMFAFGGYTILHCMVQCKCFLMQRAASARIACRMSDKLAGISGQSDYGAEHNVLDTES